MTSSILHLEWSANQGLIPNCNNIVGKDCKEAYLYLKHNFNLNVSVILKQPKFGHFNQQFVMGIRHHF